MSKMAKLNWSRAMAGNISKLCLLAEIDASSGDTDSFAWPGTNAASLMQWKNTLTNYATIAELDRRYFFGSAKSFLNCP